MIRDRFNILGSDCGKRLARVFPRRTKATPDDALAFCGAPDLFVEADEVHVDVTFTADIPKAEALAEEWRHVAPVKLGGVAYGDPGAEFVPRKYIKLGYPRDTFTLAETRLRQMLTIGFTPMAMLWQPETPSAQKYRRGPEWRRFQRRWARPAIIHAGRQHEQGARNSK